MPKKSLDANDILRAVKTSQRLMDQIEASAASVYVRKAGDVMTGNLGIGTGTVPPGELLRLKRGSAGGDPGRTINDVLTIEHNENAGLGFLVPADKTAGIFVGDPTTRLRGASYHDNRDGSWNIATQNLVRFIIEQQGRTHIQRGSAGADPVWQDEDVLIIEQSSTENGAVQLYTAQSKAAGYMFANPTDGRNRGGMAYDHAAKMLYLAADLAYRVRVDSKGLAIISGVLTAKESVTPSNPATGYRKLYPKASGTWYSLDSAGAETAIGSGGGGSIEVAGPGGVPDINPLTKLNVAGLGLEDLGSGEGELSPGPLYVSMFQSFM